MAALNAQRIAAIEWACVDLSFGINIANIADIADMFEKR